MHPPPNAPWIQVIRLQPPMATWKQEAESYPSLLKYPSDSGATSLPTPRPPLRRRSTAEQQPARR